MPFQKLRLSFFHAIQKTPFTCRKCFSPVPNQVSGLGEPYDSHACVVTVSGKAVISVKSLLFHSGAGACALHATPLVARPFDLHWMSLGAVGISNLYVAPYHKAPSTPVEGTYPKS